MGTATDPLMTDELRVTVVATGPYLWRGHPADTGPCQRTQRGEEPREKKRAPAPVRPSVRRLPDPRRSPQRDQRPQPGLRELARQENRLPLDIPAFLSPGRRTGDLSPPATFWRWTGFVRGRARPLTALRTPRLCAGGRADTLIHAASCRWQGGN